MKSYIVVLQPGGDRAGAVADAHRHGGEVEYQYAHALNGYAARLSEAAARAIQANPNVLFVSDDRELLAATHCIGSPTQCLSEGVDRIEGDRSSTRSGDGRGSIGVNVAVIDTGTDASHPDLNVVGGANCTNDKRGVTVDPGGHGTHVGGIIGELDNGIGAVGVAPGARLWSVRALNPQGVANTAMIICANDWVTSTRTDGDPTNDIAVANMSLGGYNGFGQEADDGNCGRSNRDAMHLAICASVDAGVTYAVAAANETRDVQFAFPAAYDEVLTVTAIADSDGAPGALGPVFPDFCPPDPDDTAAFFSNFATLAADRQHVVAAPGVCIRSSWPADLLPDLLPYNSISGTSMATPHAAGVVALCIASGACAGLTPPQIVEKIVADAAAYNTAKKNSGYGFQGDPLRPVSGKYYGYLIRASLY
jgi:subtilisin family serine protease